MFKRLLQVASILAIAAAFVVPQSAFADSGVCPGNIYSVPDYTPCHLTSGADCAQCKYRCEDGSTPTLNWCEA